MHLINIGARFQWYHGKLQSRWDSSSYWQLCCPITRNSRPSCAVRSTWSTWSTSKTKIADKSKTRLLAAINILSSFKSQACCMHRAGLAAIGSEPAEIVCYRARVWHLLFRRRYVSMCGTAKILISLINDDNLPHWVNPSKVPLRRTSRVPMLGTIWQLFLHVIVCTTTA